MKMLFIYATSSPSIQLNLPCPFTHFSLGSFSEGGAWQKKINSLHVGRASALLHLSSTAWAYGFTIILIKENEIK